MDAINTIYEAAETLVGRGGALVQVFSAAPAVLTFAAGRPFYNYWQVRLFNYIQPEQRYQLVIDTRDL